MSNLAMMMGLSSGAGGTPWLADLSVASYDSVSFTCRQSELAISAYVNIYQYPMVQGFTYWETQPTGFDLIFVLSICGWDISSFFI